VCCVGEEARGEREGSRVCRKEVVVEDFRVGGFAGEACLCVNIAGRRVA